MNALVHPDTPPKQVVERKSAIEDVGKHLEEMEKEAKKFTDATTQFWGSVIEDEKLVKLTKQLQDEEGQLETLNTTLRTMPLVFQITKSKEMKEFQQCVGKA